MSQPKAHFAPDARDDAVWRSIDMTTAWVALAKEAALASGDVVTHSQSLDTKEVVLAADQGGWHVVPGPLPSSVRLVRRLPDLKPGMWVAHASFRGWGGDRPLIGRVTQVASGMARVRCYSRRGEPMGIEPLNARFMVRIPEPRFPMKDVLWWRKKEDGTGYVATNADSHLIKAMNGLTVKDVIDRHPEIADEPPGSASF